MLPNILEHLVRNMFQLLLAKSIPSPEEAICCEQMKTLTTLTTNYSLLVRFRFFRACIYPYRALHSPLNGPNPVNGLENTCLNQLLDMLTFMQTSKDLRIWMNTWKLMYDSNYSLKRLFVCSQTELCMKSVPCKIVVKSVRGFM